MIRAIMDRLRRLSSRTARRDAYARGMNSWYDYEWGNAIAIAEGRRANGVPEEQVQAGLRAVSAQLAQLRGKDATIRSLL